MKYTCSPLGPLLACALPVFGLACSPRDAARDAGPPTAASTLPSSRPPPVPSELDLVLEAQAASVPSGERIELTAELVNHRLPRVSTVYSNNGCFFFIRAAREDGEELAAEHDPCGGPITLRRYTREIGLGEATGDSFPASRDFDLLQPGRYHFVAARYFSPHDGVAWSTPSFLWSNEVTVEVREPAALHLLGDAGRGP